MEGAPGTTVLAASGNGAFPSVKYDAKSPTDERKHLTPPVKASYLRKTSAEYILAAGVIILASLQFGLIDFSRIGFEHHAALEKNLRPPWRLFRWMGSVGVDVTDMQWYLFIVGVPPILPLLCIFLVLSDYLRRRSTTVSLSFELPASMSDSEELRVGPLSPALNEKLTTTVVMPSAQISDAHDGTLFPVSLSHAELEGGNGDTERFRGGPRVIIGKDIRPLHTLHIIFGLFITVGVSGPGFLFGLILFVVNYYGVVLLHHRLSFRLRTTVMWTFHVAVLFLNFHADGYRFSWFGLSILDKGYPILMAWTVHYNMAILRMIAFSNDLWESASCGSDRYAKTVAKHARTCVACALIREEYHNRSALSLPGGGLTRRTTAFSPDALYCYKCRTDCPRPLSEYNFLSYMGYMLYPPLFIAGPLSSFNAYISHLHNPTRVMSKASLAKYALRFLGNAFLLVFMMHFIFIPAILFTPPKEVKAIATDTVGKTGAISTTGTTGKSVFDLIPTKQRATAMMLVLAFLWAKFNVIWKFFRLVALMDGLDCPEDMPRCFANTVSIQDFWRDWHASFNQWIVRYMYIPMGGHKKKLLSIFPIFFFIAIWHDIEMRLLFWALFICIFFVPEMLVTTFFASNHPLVRKVKERTLLWRYLRVLGAACSMLLLILVNLIGFQVGLTGAETLLNDLAHEASWSFILLTSFLLMCAAVLATQDRDQKAYENQVLKLKFGLQSQ